MTGKANTHKSYVLNANSRDTKDRKNVKVIRDDKKIPGVIYGKDFENKLITLKITDFEKVIKEAKTSSIIDLIIDEKDHINVLCCDIQSDYRGRIIHADFYKFNEKEELEAEVQLKFIGESPAIKLGLNIMFQIDSVKVKCLPKDLISEIEIDISKLEKVDDSIKVSDISVPANIKIMEHADNIVAMVHEIKELDTKVDNTDDNLSAAKEAEVKDATETVTEGAEKKEDVKTEKKEESK